MTAFTYGPLAFLIALAGSGPRDLLDAVPTEAFWEAQQVEVSAENMLAQLQSAPEPKAGELGRLIKDLGADDYKTRQAAQQKLIRMGPRVIPRIEPMLESDDAEVAARARVILSQVSKKRRARCVRRLMAIRVLGEMRSREALDRLKALTESKTPFEADYARAATAAIRGKTRERPRPSDEQ